MPQAAWKEALDYLKHIGMEMERVQGQFSVRFGLATIQEAAKRLDGEAWCYTENQTFILDVMVKVKTKRPKS